MLILEDIRFYKATGHFPKDSLREAIFNCELFEETEGKNVPLSTEAVDVLNKINNDDYVRNDYESFVKEIQRNKRSEFLTPYTAEEFRDTGVQTFQVKGYEIGFALKPIPNGGYDIISVHNNTPVRGIGEALIDSAIRLGGRTLDHFDGFLSDFYKKKGFKEIGRYDWNPEYAPKNWNYEKYGTPSLIVRQLER